MFNQVDTITREFYSLKREVVKLRNEISELKKQTTQEQNIQKFHLLRLKNNDELPDDYILGKSSYLDLSPEQAYAIYEDIDKDFVLLDVSKNGYEPIQELPETMKIPLEELEMRIHKIHKKSVRILVISENGVRSIKACKLLAEWGYLNTSNISGGYKYWPGFRKSKNLNISTVAS